MKKLIAVLLPLLILAGCKAPVESGALPPTPPVSTISPVYTDWSKLTPYEPPQPVYTFHEGYSGAGSFEARSDYGALVPYIGKYSAMDMGVIDALPFYGLVTSKGELVSDPVYAKINFYDDFLVLYRGDPNGIIGGDVYSDGAYSRTIAAADGHWAHELTDSYYVSCGNGLLITATTDGSLDLFNTEGEIVNHFDRSLFTERFGEDFIWNLMEVGPYLNWVDDKVGYALSYYVNGEEVNRGVRLYLDFSSGAVTDTPPKGYDLEIDYSKITEDAPDPPTVDGYNNFYPITDKATGETYFVGQYRGSKDNMVYRSLFDHDGNMLVKDYDYILGIRAGLYSTAEGLCFYLRSISDNTNVFCYPMRTNSD